MEAPGRIWFGYIAAVVLVLVGFLSSDVRAIYLAIVMLIVAVLGEWYRGRQAAIAAAAQNTDLPELVARWARGWAYSRGFPRPTDVPGGVRIEVGEPERRVEWVATDDADTLGELVDTVRATPEAWLSVVTDSPGSVRPWFVDGGLAAGEAEEALMSIGLAEHPSRKLPEGYRVEVERDGGVIAVTVRSDDDAVVAAGGRIAVIGTDAVADRIQTDPGHRRLGLGGAVMGLLVSAAREAGAVRGLLVASEMGEPLYAGLGWRVEARLVTARSAAPRTSAESRHG